MTEIRRYLECAANGRLQHVDWSRPPWAAAHAALSWLGFAPSAVPPATTRAVVSMSDAEAICDVMASRFLDESGQLAWSSNMISTALRAVATAVGGPPEALLKSAWQLLADRELDKTVYEFCRALGNEIRTQFRAGADWDLKWTRSATTPSQMCLRYWILAVRPELWDHEVEEATMDVLRKCPFQF